MERKITCLLLGIVFLMGFTMKRSYHYDYIDQYCVIAIKEMHKSGIPASLILAQAIVESNCGQSKLAVNSNNHFGIKCKSYWTGSTYYHEDDDYDARGNLTPSCFRAYPNVLSSYYDHTEFLKTSPFYEGLFYIHRTDYKSWAYGLAKSGYATDKRYAKKLIRVIEDYNLSRFDTVELKLE